MPISDLLIVSGAVFAGILLFGVVVGLGALAVRLLRLPTDPPEAVVFEPPAPTVHPAGDPAAARARAATCNAAAALGRRARMVLAAARSAADEAEWIAGHDRERSGQVRTCAVAAAAAAERAAAAFRSGDVAALAAAELEASTAAARVRTLAGGLPDLQAAERRKLLLLTALLAGALALAGVTLWLR